MKKLIFLFITTLSLSGFLPAQKIPIHIKLLGSDGKPLIKAMAEIYESEKQDFTQIKIKDNGSFDLDLEKKYINLRLSGVNHQSIPLSIIIHEAKELDFQVLLPTVTYTNDFSKVRLIGNFNEWKRENAIPLKKDEKGFYYADIDMEKDTVEYQLIGLNIGNDFHSLNGTMADDYKYDNGGDFKSVIYKKGRTAHIEFDPAKLIPQSTEAKIIALNYNLPEIVMLKEIITYNNNLNRMRTEQSGPNEKPDFSKTTQGLKERSYSEKSDFLKGYFSISYLKYWPFIGISNIDTAVCRKTLELVPPESGLWKINPNLLMIAGLGFKNNLEVFENYVKSVVDKNSDIDIKAEALGHLIGKAKKDGNTNDFNIYYKRLMDECPNTNWAKKVNSDYVTLAVGKEVPDFELKSLEDKRISYSKSSLKGKFYLIDFWATWCGPCIGEQPNLKDAYNEFKDKNFEILSISLDSKKELVEKFRKEKFEMPWLHALLENGFSNEMAKTFGVTGVPKVVLVSDKGKILACDRGLRGEGLKTTLKKYLISNPDQKQE